MRARWRFHVGVLLALCGCGRLQFDELGDGGRDAGADAPFSPCFGKPFGAAVLVGSLNSTADDWAATPTLDGTEIYLQSYRPAAPQGSNIYVAHGTPPSSYATPVEETVLSAGLDVFSPTAAADGLDVIFASDQGLGYMLELWESTRMTTSSSWTAPARIGELGTDALHELDPWLTPDGLGIYFAKGPDLTSATLWHATRPLRTTPWSPPVPVPVSGAGPFAVSPTLSADEREIFFATDIDSPGDLDIVTARRSDPAGAFGPLERLSILNTSGDDAALRLSLDGQYLYLVQNADYELGNGADISLATRVCN